jgi:glutathione synthase/RimK-type ligase-like ATP-grasp enzyme
MSILLEQQYNLFSLEDTLWLLTAPVNVANYDFAFEQFFSCHHPWQPPSQITVVARIGAHKNYVELYKALEMEGIQLIHTPQEQQKCSELPYWYPLLKDLTPRSIWFAEMPSVEHITEQFEFPIFLKGARQTSKHKRRLSIIENIDALSEALTEYQHDAVLWWQSIVGREYVPLMPVSDDPGEGIPASFEFRTFWWKRQLVGAGRYWFESPIYTCTAQEEREALAIAQEAANRLVVPFLVIDVAQRADGRWIVIEVNDGQESGYAGISPFQLWRNVLNIEQHRIASDV